MAGWPAACQPATCLAARWLADFRLRNGGENTGALRFLTHVRNGTVTLQSTRVSSPPPRGTQISHRATLKLSSPCTPSAAAVVASVHPTALPGPAHHPYKALDTRPPLDGRKCGLPPAPPPYPRAQVPGPGVRYPGPGVCWRTYDIFCRILNSWGYVSTEAPTIITIIQSQTGRKW